MRKGVDTVGRQRVNAGSVNLDLTFGSPLDAVYNSYTGIMRDLETQQMNTKSEVLDLERERTNYTSQADASRSRAKYERSAGTLRTLGAAVSGFGDIYKASFT